MSDEVTLVNRSKRTHVIVLDHDVFREKRWGFQIQKGISIGEDNAGVRTERSTRRAIPGSITLFPGDRIEGLHPAIERVPQVATLLRNREVVIEQAEEKGDGDSDEGKEDSPQKGSKGATLFGKHRRTRKKAEGR